MPGLGRLCAVSVALEDEPPTRLVIARGEQDGFDPEELGLLRAMGRVLVLTLRMLRGLAAERSLREGAERERATASRRRPPTGAWWNGCPRSSTAPRSGKAHVGHLVVG